MRTALNRLSRRAMRRVALLAAMLIFQGAAPVMAADRPDQNAVDNWQKIRPALFRERSIAADAEQMIELVTPVRAEDAAVVPVAIRTRLAQSPDRYIKRLYLIIDKNPAPLAAVFNMTPEAGRADIETRVRVEEYTDIRVVVEMNDDSLHMTSRYVKASGGCSAPAGKDPAAAMAGIGRIKLTLEQTPQLNRPVLAQLMIKHPNFSGLAMDQVTRLYTPPHYVKRVDIAYNGKPVMSADTDISISENPNFRFYFLAKQEGKLMVEVLDSQDASYRATLPVRMN
jgi:sulfur-oxidizing protein SoxY